MATLYIRRNRIWVSWYEGKIRQSKSTGLLANEMEKAKLVKLQIERELLAGRVLGPNGGRPRNFGGYRKWWIQDRRDRGVGSADDDEGRLKHAFDLDPLALLEVRPRHIRDLIAKLRREGELAPRTVRHVYGTLHRLFEDAKIDELILDNPCTLKKGDLPGKVDADPTWRPSAIFTRSEVELLLSSELVPFQRRALYAALFLTGMRIGEAAALRWRSYELDHKPLGKLVVALSFNRKRQVEKSVKVEGKTREVPVHPALAAVLAIWKVGGWSRYMDTTPKPEDLIFPTPKGRNLRDPVVYANLQRDLEALKLRPRRTHDTRRTFISLAQADGAAPHILKWVTHGAPADIMSLYTSHTWQTLCAEVSKLNIRIREIATFSLHASKKSPGGE